MSDRPDPTSIGAGVFFLLVGVVFLLDELDVWQVRLSFVLPLLLIAVGLALVLGWAASTATDR